VQLWPEALTVSVAEADPREGECVLLATTQRSATRTEYHAFAKAKGTADLMFPAEVIVMESLPLLGSGKLDVCEVERMIRDRQRDAA
jgi:acyl-[acyl-carrier-protein]-phospholipid O-acyltransferase / long-chain-fatty-acid--[acyl-carrier-protein] ligase